MPSLISQQWQEKISGFFSSSGMKLRDAGQSAGSFVEEVAKETKVNVVDVAERVERCSKACGQFFSSLRLDMPCKNTCNCCCNNRDIGQKGITETKEKVSIGKIKMEEAAKKTAQKSKILLTDIERWQKSLVLQLRSLSRDRSQEGLFHSY